MFQTTIKDVIKVPGLEYLHLIGNNTIGSACIGDFITDGNREYEIISIPLMRMTETKPIDEVDICIQPVELSLDEFIGKTLYKIY